MTTIFYAGLVTSYLEDGRPVTPKANDTVIELPEFDPATQSLGLIAAVTDASEDYYEGAQGGGHSTYQFPIFGLHVFTPILNVGNHRHPCGTIYCTSSPILDGMEVDTSDKYAIPSFKYRHLSREVQKAMFALSNNLWDHLWRSRVRPEALGARNYRELRKRSGTWQFT